MAAPDLTNEFNGVSGLLKGLFMWLFGMNDENGKPVNFMDLIKSIFSPGAAPSGTPAGQQPTPTATAATVPVSLPASTPPAAAPQTTHKLATYGNSLALGYGQGLTKEFGAANVANHGVSGAGFHKGGIPLAHVDWTTMKDTTVLISVGTNDVGSKNGKDQAGIDDYARQVMKIATNVTKNGGTPILVAMRAPDKPLSYKDKDNVTHTQTQAEFAAWKDTMNKMNDAVARAATAQGVKFVTQEGGDYVAGGVHQTVDGYRHTADNALKQAGITVAPAASTIT